MAGETNLRSVQALFGNISAILKEEEIYKKGNERFIAYQLKHGNPPITYRLPKNSVELSELLSLTFALAGFHLLGEDEQEIIKRGGDQRGTIFGWLEKMFPETEVTSICDASGNILHHAFCNTDCSLKYLASLDGDNREENPWDNLRNPLFSRVHQAIALADRRFFCPYAPDSKQTEELEAIISRSNDSKKIESAANYLINHGAYTINPTKSHCGQIITASIVNYFYNIILAVVDPQNVYEIGTGTGCQLANTSLLLPESRIISVEYFKELAECAGKNLGEMYNSYDGLMEIAKNIEIINGNGFDFEQQLKKWGGAKPDFIYLCAAINENDDRLNLAFGALRDGGFLLAPVVTTQYEFQVLRLYHKKDGEIAQLDLSFIQFGMIL